MSNRPGMEAAGLAALQGELEVILTESAKAAAARCVAVCRARLEEEQRLFMSDQVVELNQARARLEEALTAGEEMRQHLKRTGDIPASPSASRSAASAGDKADRLSGVSVQSLGDAWTKGLENMRNVNTERPRGKIETETIFRNIFRIRDEIQKIEEAPEPVRQELRRTKSQALQQPDHGNVLDAFNRIRSGGKRTSLQSSGSCEPATTSQQAAQPEATIVENGSTSRPADIFAAIAEDAKRTTDESLVKACEAKARDVTVARQAATPPVYLYGAHDDITPMDGSPTKETAKETAKQTLMDSSSIKDTAKETLEDFLGTPVKNHNAVPLFPDPDLGRSTTSASSEAPMNLQTDSPSAASATAAVGRLSPSRIGAGSMQSPDSMSSQTRPASGSSSSAGEAAKAYAARNAELGRCLAEITADLQRACIISSSCKSSLRLNSNSPLRREAMATSPSRQLNAASPSRP